VFDATAYGTVKQWTDLSDDAYVTKVSSAFSAAVCKAGTGRDWVQGTVADRPTVSTIGTRQACLGDGVNHWLASTGWTTIASGTQTIMMVIDPQVSSGTLDYLLHTNSPAFVLAMNTDTDGKVGFYDGAWSSIADGATGAQVLTFHAPNTSGGNATMYRNLTSLGADAYTHGASGTTIAILSNTVGDPTRCCNTKFGEMVWWADALTDQARIDATTALMTKWGIS